MDSTADSSSGYLRSNSGGRIRSLHLTSAENPFHGQQSATVQMAEKQQHEQLSNIKSFSRRSILRLSYSSSWGFFYVANLSNNLKVVFHYFLLFCFNQSYTNGTIK